MSEELQEIHEMVETVKRDSEVGRVHIQMLEDIKKQAQEITELTRENTRQAQENVRQAEEIIKQAQENARLMEENLRLREALAHANAH